MGFWLDIKGSSVKKIVQVVGWGTWNISGDSHLQLKFKLFAFSKGTFYVAPEYKWNDIVKRWWFAPICINISWGKHFS